MNWVKVSDRLPELNTDVLVSDGERVEISYIRKYRVRPFWYNCDPCNEIEPYEITHWAELPPVPENPTMKQLKMFKVCRECVSTLQDLAANPKWVKVNLADHSIKTRCPYIPTCFDQPYRLKHLDMVADNTTGETK